MFEQEILQNLVGNGAVFDNIKIELNRKRGQSLTFTISEANGKKLWIAKFFDYLEGIKLQVKQEYSSLDELLNDLDNLDKLNYDVEDIIASIELQQRFFSRYIKVLEVEELNCFPRLVCYKQEVKIGDSFYGILIEEFIDGQSLEERLKGNEINKLSFVLDFLIQVGGKLRELSKNNIVHRDLSPDNIMINENCEFILIDPGMVKMEDGGVTRSRMMLGKSFYASPEQYFGNARNVSFQSDLYSIGIISLEIILGYNPLKRIIIDEKLSQPHHALIRNYHREIQDSIFSKIGESELTKRLIFTIRKLIQVDRNNRFDSVDSFLDVLRTIVRMERGENE